MAEIVNLNKVRKARARAEAARGAANNRAKHGRTKAERKSEADTRERIERLLDQSKTEE